MPRTRAGPRLPENPMAQSIRPVAIVGSQRIPFCRIFTGYADIGNLEMLSAAVKALVDKYNLKGQILGDVVAGAVMKHSRDWSMAREAVLRSEEHTSELQSHVNL